MSFRDNTRSAVVTVVGRSAACPVPNGRSSHTEMSGPRVRFPSNVSAYALKRCEYHGTMAILTLVHKGIRNEHGAEKGRRGTCCGPTRFPCQSADAPACSRFTSSRSLDVP